MQLVRLSLFLVSLGAAGTAFAGPQAERYCNDMYPADSYDAEERSLFVSECIESYGEEIEEEAAAVEEYEETPVIVETEEAAYDGTVEEFVESIPSEEESQPEGY